MGYPVYTSFRAVFRKSLGSDGRLSYSRFVLFASVELWRKTLAIGPLRTVRLLPRNIKYARRAYFDYRFDRRYGVDTSGWAYLDELDISSGTKCDGSRYQPSSYKRLVAAFSLLPTDCSEFTFLDFGSGKGRVLLFASLFNFKKIVGVEFSGDLHQAAVRNIARWRDPRKKCFDIDSVLVDATMFSIPSGPLVMYLFDPFRGAALERVLLNIRLSYLADPRKMYLIYLAPREARAVLATGVFKKTATLPLDYDPSLSRQYKLAVFEVDPSRPPL